MKLNQLQDNAGATQARKRVGRGIGSGLGKTCGKGHKGQKSRRGVAIKGFEGGQMPIHMRLPKRGFNSRNRVAYEVINLDRLEKAIADKRLDAKKPIDIDALKAAGLVRPNGGNVKLLATGEVSKKLTISVTKASAAAVAAVEKAGGSVTLVAPVAVEAPADS